MTWKRTTEAKYEEMLGVLPPAHQVYGGFLVGEAVDHNDKGEPRFRAYAKDNGAYFVSDEPMTIAEFIHASRFARK